MAPPTLMDMPDEILLAIAKLVEPETDHETQAALNRAKHLGIINHEALSAAQVIGVSCQPMAQVCSDLRKVYLASWKLPTVKTLYFSLLNKNETARNIRACMGCPALSEVVICPFAILDSKAPGTPTGVMTTMGLFSHSLKLPEDITRDDILDQGHSSFPQLLGRIQGHQTMWAAAQPLLEPLQQVASWMNLQPPFQSPALDLLVVGTGPAAQEPRDGFATIYILDSARALKGLITKSDFDRCMAAKRSSALSFNTGYYQHVREWLDESLG
ncbi:hypothetical protein B9Z65_976 [Elsinoe australis]|uniref:Uncharacterized protein n=1 Tax=Elsinoe australis TaxID=40998 RepID=A0A2P8AK31_9PEZI|nr:hypothetical protein B9Z65_976 [Elsinoe australis]